MIREEAIEKLCEVYMDNVFMYGEWSGKARAVKEGLEALKNQPTKERMTREELREYYSDRINELSDWFCASMMDAITSGERVELVAFSRIGKINEIIFQAIFKDECITIEEYNELHHETDRMWRLAVEYGR